MNILDCTHYTSVYNSEELKGVAPVDWVYGIKLSFSVPDTGCDRCGRSGGTCGFDVETEGLVCICSGTMNSTTECGKKCYCLSNNIYLLLSSSGLLMNYTY